MTRSLTPSSRWITMSIMMMLVLLASSLIVVTAGREQQSHRCELSSSNNNSSSQQEKVGVELLSCGAEILNVTMSTTNHHHGSNGNGNNGTMPISSTNTNHNNNNKNPNHHGGGSYGIGGGGIHGIKNQTSSTMFKLNFLPVDSYNNDTNLNTTSEVNSNNGTFSSDDAYYAFLDDAAYTDDAAYSNNNIDNNDDDNDDNNKDNGNNSDFQQVSSGASSTVNFRSSSFQVVKKKNNHTHNGAGGGGNGMVINGNINTNQPHKNKTFACISDYDTLVNRIANATDYEVISLCPGHLHVKNTLLIQGVNSITISCSGVAGSCILDANEKKTTTSTKTNTSKTHTVDMTIHGHKIVGVSNSSIISGIISREQNNMLGNNATKTNHRRIIDFSKGDGLTLIGITFQNGYATSTNQTTLPVKSGSSGSGGAIRIRAHSGFLAIQIQQCTFINNYSDKYGGALHIGNHACSVVITNSTFISNYAKVSGGAVSLHRSQNGITCRLPCYLLQDEPVFVNNTAGRNGGAIYTNFWICGGLKVNGNVALAGHGRCNNVAKEVDATGKYYCTTCSG